MKKLVVLMAVALSGCVSTQVVSSNQNTVVVKASLENPAEAQSLADGECGKHQKSASLNQFVAANIVWANYFFDCKVK